MSNTTRLLAIITALILIVVVASLGFNALSRSNAQDKLETAMEEMATAETEADLQKAFEKAAKALEQGAEVNKETHGWAGEWDRSHVGEKF